MTMNSGPLFRFTSWLLLGCSNFVSGEEVLLHSGPTVRTPALGLKLPSAEIPGREITYHKNFYIDSAEIPAIRFHHDSSPEFSVTAERAISLIKKRGELPGKVVVTRLELLSARVTDDAPIDYYLIEYRVNGSTEHRLVLMNEKVVSPRLEKPTAPGE